MGKFLNFTAEIEVESPGRINLIGEHIDYNGGFVLPTAIDKVIHFKLKKRKDNLIHVESIGFKNPLKITIASASFTHSSKFLVKRQLPSKSEKVSDSFEHNSFSICSGKT